MKQHQNDAAQHQTIDMDDDNDNDDNSDNDERKEEEDEARRVKERTEKYNRIMEKGNKRTDAAFGTVQQQKQRNNNDNETNNDDEEEDADDAFLNAALAKARRMHRLRELNAKAATTTAIGGVVPEKRKVGADAVVQSIDDMQNKVHKIQSSSSNTNGGKNGNDESRVTFELDATKEFTRSLRALTTTPKVEIMEGAATEDNKASKSTESSEVMDTINNERGVETNNTIISTNMDIEDDTPHKNDKEEEDEPSFEKLADQVQEDPIDATGFGSASTLPVGRGLANVLSMLKHTGEITGKNAGKEEVRGRAKDERNYELYDPLDLKKVVTINRTAGMNGATVHEKDLELANREIKYDHRDKHGRLLTQKEAYRDLCYQFHGYGSSKKNEERRLRQIERERAERSITTRQLGGGGSGRTGAGTLGALKATQKATGKAFVLHKA